MSNIIVVTSCKGGVGKSTIAANISVFLAHMGKKTLLIDCDLGIRCLDIILGLENSIVYDLYDILVHGIPVSKAVVDCGVDSKLFFCAAPYKYEPNEKFTVESFANTIGEAVEAENYEYVIIDTAADLRYSLNMAAALANMALIIATHHPASIRGAERAGVLLDEINVKNKIKEKRMIVNCFDFEAVKLNIAPAVMDIIDKTYLRLIGIIPISNTLSHAQYDGCTAYDLKETDHNSYAAFMNITERITGKNIPLFTNFKMKEKKRRSLLAYY